jgi:hypothetical protein
MPEISSVNFIHLYIVRPNQEQAIAAAKNANYIGPLAGIHAINPHLCDSGAALKQT